MYTIMNEFGQVVAWWFTTGTAMAELEESVTRLKQRYQLLGYDNPESFTTDCCCQERNYWNRILSFLDQQVNTDHVHEEDIETVDVAGMLVKGFQLNSKGN